ncbi:MAG: methylated-DNA--[protein]-cysteine S-methyltransferase [Phormidesmis sp.]
MIYYTWLESPVGELLLTANSESMCESLTGLYLKGQKHFPELSEDWVERTEFTIFEQVKTQLGEYFAHKRETFDIPLSPRGTDFQKQVWQFLHQIPFGQTASYGELATRLGKPGAARAVGAANGRNPISIIVPCHRVVGASGKLTGYAGGIDRKQWLLRHEQARQMALF